MKTHVNFIIRYLSFKKLEVSSISTSTGQSSTISSIDCRAIAMAVLNKAMWSQDLDITGDMRRLSGSPLTLSASIKFARRPLFDFAFAFATASHSFDDVRIVSIYRLKFVNMELQGDARQTGYVAQPPMEMIPAHVRGDGIITQPTQQSLQSVGTGSENYFRYTLFGCVSNVRSCLLSSFCPCILWGTTRARLMNPRSGSLQVCTNGCWSYAAIMTCCPCILCIYSSSQRGDIRTRYGIGGNGFLDCLIHCFCECCVSRTSTTWLILGFGSRRQWGSVERRWTHKKCDDVHVVF